MARTEVARTEVARTDAAYASELPDLSGPKPRSPGSRRGGGEPAHRPGLPRVQVASRSVARCGPSCRSRPIDRGAPSKGVAAAGRGAVLRVDDRRGVPMPLVLGGMGVWSKLNSNVGDLLTSTSGGGELVSSGTIFGGAALIGLVNIVLLAAMATIGTFIYNLSTDIVGGIEVTLGRPGLGSSPVWVQCAGCGNLVARPYVKYGPIAQAVERFADNEEVGGSSPPSPRCPG